MPSKFTVQDAHGIYQFDGVGEALATLTADMREPGRLYNLQGKVAAEVDLHGLRVFQPLPVVIQRLGTHPADEFAVIVNEDAYVIGGPFGNAASIIAYLQHGWVITS